MKSNKLDKKGIWPLILKGLLALVLLLLILSLIKTLHDCNNVHCYKHVRTIVDDTGYLPDNEDWDVIPDTIPPYHDDDIDSLPDRISLEPFFPPIGDQGQYGTCVAWATGYNLTTALNAIKNHWTPQDLEKPENQTSPKDLWMGVPALRKGPYCTGTTFESAFSVLLADGVEHMDKVPYEHLGNCNGKYIGNTSNTLARYRHVVSGSSSTYSPSGDALPSLKQIKAYLRDTVPLVVAAHLGDDFMTWRGDGVLRNDTYLGPDAMHAFHAMALVGYDDGKKAFRLRNSWGKQWGDQGSIWVDYDYFMNKFCTEVFMAEK